MSKQDGIYETKINNEFFIEDRALQKETMVKKYPDEMEGYDAPLNDQQERYCQLRAEGFTKTKAAKIAWPNDKHPGKYGHVVERKLKIRERIAQLKDERKELSDNLSLEEQIRHYQDIYQLCKEAGKAALALKALERLDMLAGYDIKRSETLRRTTTDNPLDNEDPVQEAVKKFSNILGTHGERPRHQSDTASTPSDTPKKPAASNTVSLETITPTTTQ
jgi:hypothetical protein